MNLEERIRAELNPAQAEAVLVSDRPQLILAGPGSGKTRVLTWKIAWLIGGLQRKPWEIVALTFTNKAAKEMRECAEKLLGGQAPEWMGTFHGICARILRHDAGLLGYGDAFTIYDDDDQRKEINEACQKLGIKTPTETVFRSIISSCKNRDEGPEQLAAAFDPVSKSAAKVFTEYQKALKAADAMDFDDLLLNTLELFRRFPDRLEYWQKRFGYILIDEFQDTNAVQYNLVKLLASHGRIMVVGDDDQSIYSCRDADFQNILDFEKDYPGAHVVKLEQNYRSTGNILKVAGSVIKNNKGRKEKTLFTTEAEGDLVSLWCEEDEMLEARRCAGLAKEALTKGESFATLYRTDSQSRVIEDAMRREGVPYVMIGGTRFYDRAEVKDALAWLRLLVNPKDFRALERAAQTPRRGIGKKTIEHYRDAAEWNHGGDLVAALADNLPNGMRCNKAQEMALRLRTWQEALSEEVKLEEFVELAIVDSGLEAALENEANDESKECLANLQELVSVAKEFGERNPDAGLKGFLEEVALVSDADTKNAEGKAAVLMTLHTSKGMEFDVACLVGCEEGLFPLLRQGGGLEALEEERRLFYVGATRARKKLHLLHARARTKFGVCDQTLPSRFLDEIDSSALDLESPALLRRSSDGLGESDEFPSRAVPMARRPAFPPGALRAAARPDSMPITGRSYDGPSAGHTSRPPAAATPTDSTPFPEHEGLAGGCVYRAGLRVKHAKFGIGTIVKVHGRGTSTRLDVQFSAETKHFVANCDHRDGNILHLLFTRICTLLGMRSQAQPSNFLDELDSTSLDIETPSGALRSFGGATTDLDEMPSAQAQRPAFPPGALRSSARPEIMPITRRSFDGPSAGVPSSRAPQPAMPPKCDPFPDYKGVSQANEVAYCAGQRVSHPKFGLGRILRVDHSTGSARLDVQFGAETKRLVAAFANLTVLG